MKILKINTDFIKLDTALKLAGITDTGGQGKILIQEGFIYVNGEQEFRRGRKCISGDRIQFEEEEILIE
ncbi:MAG: RNA-binding S4 domain-containing protein [Tissierellia bacterium]|nr:RNA-binding S4 domain-containing protein [Tissierellia bacterium]